MTKIYPPILENPHNVSPGAFYLTLPPTIRHERETEKMSILYPWLGPESTSEGGYNTLLKIQTEISPWKQVKMDSF